MRKKHTFIIGGTRGSGRAIVKLLSENNHVISVIGRRPPSEIDHKLLNVHFWTLDLLDEERLCEVCAEAIEQNGKLDNLVFFQRYRGKGDDWKGEIEVSLTATKNVIEYFVDQFNDTNESSIIVISSIASYLIADEQPLSYHVVKAGINQMVRYYAVILGPKGIRVNSVSPGSILKDENKDFYFQNEKLLNLYKKITPLGRMGTSKDIANVVVFLCSRNASFITGQDIIVDGGLSLQWHETLARKLTHLNQLKVTRKTLGEQNG